MFLELTLTRPAVQYIDLDLEVKTQLHASHFVIPAVNLQAALK